MRFGSPTSASSAAPLRLEFLLLGQFLAFSDFLKLRVKLRQFGGVQAELGNAALVLDRHRGLVGNGALNIVDGNVIAENRPRVRIRLFDGRAGEPMNDAFGKASRTQPPRRFSSNISTGIAWSSRQTVWIGRSDWKLTSFAGPRKLNGDVVPSTLLRDRTKKSIV